MNFSRPGSQHGTPCNPMMQINRVMGVTMLATWKALGWIKRPSSLEGLRT